nr:MAG TPA: hypothetical protein [Caudoviricetes sp.]
MIFVVSIRIISLFYCFFGDIVRNIHFSLIYEYYLLKKQ